MSRDDLARLLDVPEVEAPELPISWNVAPTEPVYTMGADREGTRKLKALTWGFVPFWAKDPRSAFINARAETLAEKAVFRASLRARRAIVAVSGFYEWKRPSLGEKASKQPFYFEAADHAPLAVAALWDAWRDVDGSVLRTVALVTTEANETMRAVHGRMPALLAPSAWDEWLGPRQLGPGRACELLVPAPEALLTCWEVGPAVNSVRNNGPELVQPVCEPPARPSPF